jgi:hypothetical protein
MDALCSKWEQQEKEEDNETGHKCLHYEGKKCRQKVEKFKITVFCDETPCGFGDLYQHSLPLFL